MQTITLSPAGKRLLNTKKHKALIGVQSAVTIHGGWSGGSREYATAYDYTLRGLWTEAEKQPITGNGFNVSAQPYQIGPAQFVINSGIFMGKPATPVIYCGSQELMDQLVASLTR